MKNNKNKTETIQESENPVLGIASVRRCICPKCKSSDLILTELWINHSIQWHLNGETLGKGNAEPGDPYKVKAFCNECNHEWRLRGVTQISDVFPYFA